MAERLEWYFLRHVVKENHDQGIRAISIHPMSPFHNLVASLSPSQLNLYDSQHEDRLDLFLYYHVGGIRLFRLASLFY